MKAGTKLYLNQNVYDAATERISTILDHFENIVISVSGGKDSTVLYNLCRDEAVKRDRKVNVMFLDQEAEYQSTIDQVKYLMTREGVNPYWFQVPLKMTNSTSLQQDFLYAWGPGEKWMREKDPIAIHHIDEKYPQRFYKFLGWWNKFYWEDIENTCFLVGLRAEESLNRFRSVVKNAGWNNYMWTTKTNDAVKAYPLYDWTFEDIWHYIAENNIKYNRVYDFMHWRGHRIQDVRVSYLGHEHSMKCLESLPEFEPETYRNLLERMPGAHVAQRYSKEKMIYNASERPPTFKTWRAYRDYLLETTPTKHYDRFKKRFENQGNDENVCRQQCRQLMIDDFEQNTGLLKPKKSKEDKLAKWRKIL